MFPPAGAIATRYILAGLLGAPATRCRDQPPSGHSLPRRTRIRMRPIGRSLARPPTVTRPRNRNESTTHDDVEGLVSTGSGHTPPRERAPHATDGPGTQRRMIHCPRRWHGLAGWSHQAHRVRATCFITSSRWRASSLGPRARVDPGVEKCACLGYHVGYGRGRRSTVGRIAPRPVMRNLLSTRWGPGPARSPGRHGDRIRRRRRCSPPSGWRFRCPPNAADR
ncbi:hypothetical protein FB390_6657 [Nocardia bhagyanarayanae]|uniref:Uncharacterized protein n=1 Tax=Nocardia bhagyanarayanae TaxID=1215925 RepID=A0A543EXZ4_9NOCA|nr:hypothetical protein FB390_6657 [Nocardia bhagyanarayanae]